MGGFNLFDPFDQSISSIRSAACYQPVPQKCISNNTVIPGRIILSTLIQESCSTHNGKIEKLITRNESHRYMRRMSISVSITRCWQISSQIKALQDTVSQRQWGISDCVIRNKRWCLGGRNKTNCNNTALLNPETKFRLASCNKHLSIGAVLLHILCLYLGINFHMQHCFCRPLSIEISEQINSCGPSNI